MTKLPEPSECDSCRLIKFYEKERKHFCSVVTKKNEIYIYEMKESGPEIIATVVPSLKQSKSKKPQFFIYLACTIFTIKMKDWIEELDIETTLRNKAKEY